MLASELRRTAAGSGFYIVTNSRALHAPAARKLVKEVCQNLVAASEETGVKIEIVSRSDSTLRGHFPLEPEVIEEVLGQHDAWLLAPFFLQGGRYTIGDTHYVAEEEKLVPVGDTEFAKDKTFGFRSSDLKEWVEEKSRGSIEEDKVASLGLDLIRTKGADGVAEFLRGVDKGTVVVVNAAAEEDMDVVVQGVLKATEAGKKFLYRTGAAFVSARLAISPIPPKSAADLQMDGKVGGLIVAGSYVPKTTSQLVALVIESGGSLTHIVLDVPKLLAGEESRETVLAAALQLAETELSRGQDVLVMTSRTLISGANKTESLNIGTTVAEALVDFMKRLTVRPRYVIAKGGITSSDVATKVLNMRRAMVVGQAASGVPLWRCDEEEARWPGLPYVVFPGNVGSTASLYYLVRGWRAPAA